MDNSHFSRSQNLSVMPYWCIVGLLVLIIGSSCQTKAKQEATTSAVTQTVAAPSSQVLTYKLTAQAQNTWGYDIYSNEQLVIHQPNIPALPGNTGFKTQEQATNVALAVIKKMNAGEMPPTLSVEELQTLMK